MPGCGSLIAANIYTIQSWLHIPRFPLKLQMYSLTIIKNQMKKFLFLLPAIMFMMAGLPAFSQKYKTASDTVNLNIEYTKVTNDIAELTTKLNKAQDELTRYTRKSDEATADAQSTAAATTDKASQATNGSVKDARRAKKEARRSVKDAKDSRNAKNNLDDQNKKIEKLNADLAKKQDRLKELDAMRASINSQPH